MLDQGLPVSGPRGAGMRASCQQGSSLTLWTGRGFFRREPSSMEVRVATLGNETLQCVVAECYRAGLRTESTVPVQLGGAALCRCVLGRLAVVVLKREAHHRLGFARLDDVSRERLGLSARELRSAARVVAVMSDLPGIGAAFRALRSQVVQ